MSNQITIVLKRRLLLVRLYRSFIGYRKHFGILGAMRNAWYINKAH